MPIYLYEIEGEPCPVCGATREEFQHMADEPLTRCPHGHPMHRVPAAGIVRVNKLTKSNIEGHGFKRFFKDETKGGYRPE